MAEEQTHEIIRKLTTGLERISEAFKVMLWEKAKEHGLSPIQIQILIFISDHKSELCNVSHLAKEFNITKPTISDAIRVLDKKGLIVKDFSPTDSRSYTIFPSSEGKKMIRQLGDFSNPLKGALQSLDHNNLENLYTNLTTLIYQLNRSGLLNVQRTCFGCSFYENRKGAHYCNFLESTLQNYDLRMDCSDYIQKNGRLRI